MFIQKPLPFIQKYLNSLDDALKEYNPGKTLSRTQKYWLGFCIMGILLTNSINWTAFARISLGQYNTTALSWMFRHSKIAWEIIFHMSLRIILKGYGITKGVLAIDDSDKKRSKSAKTIYGIHKVKDKSTGGYFMGQQLVFLILITPRVTIPAGFAFHLPDPALSKWYKEKKKLKKQGIPSLKHPKKPKRDPQYPTMGQISLALMREFKKYHADICIQAIVADALYGTDKFMNGASGVFDGIQVVSQLRTNQKVMLRKRSLSLETYFKRYPPVRQKIRIRGGDEVSVYVSSARLYVHAHKQKRFVIALKYEGETECRYLVASDMTWQTLDIVQVYTLRWLIEVFLQDHKANEGWGSLAKQPGEEGSYRSLTLSLLVDHCLLFHPDQLALNENNLPAKTVGSLCEAIKVESILTLMQDIMSKSDPKSEFERLSMVLKEQFSKSNLSGKHMNARIWGNFQPSPSLRYRAAA